MGYKAPILLNWDLKCCIIEELENPYNCSLQTFAELALLQPLPLWKDRAKSALQRYLWPT